MDILLKFQFHEANKEMPRLSCETIIVKGNHISMAHGQERKSPYRIFGETMDDVFRKEDSFYYCEFRKVWEKVNENN